VTDVTVDCVMTSAVSPEALSVFYGRESFVFAPKIVEVASRVP